MAMQQALNVANLVMDGVIRAYEAYGRMPSVEAIEPLLAAKPEL